MADNLDHRKMTKEVSKDSELEKKMELVKKMLTNWKETLIQEGIEGKKKEKLKEHYKDVIEVEKEVEEGNDIDENEKEELMNKMILIVQEGVKLK